MCLRVAFRKRITMPPQGQEEKEVLEVKRGTLSIYAKATKSVLQQFPTRQGSSPAHEKGPRPRSGIGPGQSPIGLLPILGWVGRNVRMLEA